MFKRLAEDGAGVALTIDGNPVRARSVDTVAAALLAAGLDRCRTTPVTGAPRLPYCLMGVCFDCLVTIDGVGSRQACLVPVREGMKVETQQGKREAGR
jgi:sarcosine oxidase subunit alpha